MMGRPVAGRVLVIEDDPDLRPVMEQLLTEAGYSVTTAATGHGGLREFDAQEPDLVLLDLVLPDLDGLEVCRRIRARSEVPIIMLTGVTAESVTVAGLHTGADDYVTKPFSERELLARVRAALRRHALDAGPAATGEAQPDHG